MAPEMTELDASQAYSHSANRDHRRRLDAIRREVGRLESQLKVPRDEEQVLEKELRDEAWSISPISHLPDDLLLEIFKWTIPSITERTRSYNLLSLRNDVAPMLLCRVCKQWKEVVKGHPSFWSTLRIFMPELSASPDHGGSLCVARETQNVLQRAVRQWLRATKSSPIQLHVVSIQRRLQGFSVEMPPSYWMKSMSSRLTKLTLRGIFEGVLEKSYSSDMFPVLEDLIVTIRSYPQPERNADGYVKPIRTFKQCPRLKRAAIQAPKLVLPYRQLSHLLLISPVQYSFYTHILADAPQLQYLSTRCLGYYEGDGRPIRPCHWPRLLNLSLRLSINWNRNIVPLSLTPQALQSLSSLRLHGPHYTKMHSTPTKFLAWLEQVPDSLRHLSLCFRRTDDAPLLEIFKLTRTITSLDLQMDELIPDVDPFVILLQDSTLLPDLRTLKLEVGPHWMENFDKASFLHFVEARARNATPRLEGVVIRLAQDANNPRLPGMLHFKELEAFRQEGLHVEVYDVTKERVEIGHWNSYLVLRDSELMEDWPEVRDFLVHSNLPKRLRGW